MHNVGRTFSSNSAPGFAIGIGSVGPYLKDYANSNTFFSDDGGQFWKEVKSGPHLFEILDSGSILVLVKSGSPTNEVSYSLDRGATWKSQEIKIGGGEGKWMATFSDTDDDAVTSKMIIFAAPESDSGNHPYNIIHLDFSGLRSRKCETPDSEQASQLKDFEIWRPGSPSEVGEPCMLGLKQGFYRKKADVDCFVGGLLAKKTITPLACECVKQDYECGYNYVPKDPTSSSLECILSSEKSTKNQPYDCKTGDKFVAHPYSKIPGDGCKQKKDDEWAKGIETDCQARSKPPGQVVVDPPEGRDPKVKMTEMNGLVTDLRYFPGSSVAIAISALSDSIYRTDNEGQTWTELIFFKDKGKIVQILFHPTSLSRAFILVQSSTESNIWYTNDRFASVPMRFVTPKPFNNLGVPVLSFHIEKEDWILFIGMDDGHTSLFASYDNGSGWSNEEEQWVEKCEFGRTLGLTKVEEKSVYCQKHKYTGSKSQPRRGQVAGAFSLQKIVPGILYNDKRELFPDGILDFYGLGGDLFAIMVSGKEKNWGADL